MMGVTHKQQRLFGFLCKYIADHGTAPTYVEMMRFMGLRSKSAIHRLLTALEDRGRIRRLYGKRRAIEIIETTKPVCPNCGYRIVTKESACQEA